jgi:hypothetical protein
MCIVISLDMDYGGSITFMKSQNSFLITFNELANECNKCMDKVTYVHSFICLFIFTTLFI